MEHIITREICGTWQARQLFTQILSHEEAPASRLCPAGNQLETMPVADCDADLRNIDARHPTPRRSFFI